jgi:hypothetical protein
MNKPPCSEWKIWKGPEIEGTEGVGIATLFIRSLSDFEGLTPESDFSLFAQKSGCKRVWFCKEFYLSEPTDTNGKFIAWKLIEAIGQHFEEMCLEVEPQSIQCVPKSIRAKARIYVKVNVELKPGDFICVGPAFNDESFKIGTGAKVTPEQYLQDIKIK